MTEPVIVERVIDLPRVIVEDAFVDPDLVEGWYHPTQRPDLDSGIQLREITGGTRGFSTVVTVAADPEGCSREDVTAEWEHRLDLLENLLRGHPVEWSTQHVGRQAQTGEADGVPNSAAR